MTGHPKQVRSPRRARPGIRMLLLILLAVILSLLVAWLLGLKPPFSWTGSREPESQPSPVVKAAYREKKEGGRPRSTWPRFAPAPPAPAGRPGSGSLSEASGSTEQLLTRGPQLAGPCWFSAVLPPELHHEKSVTARWLSAWGPLAGPALHGTRMSLTDGRIFGTTLSAPGPRYLEIESSDRIDLFGPFTLPAWTQTQLGTLASTGDMLTLESSASPGGIPVAVPEVLSSLYSRPLLPLSRFGGDRESRAWWRARGRLLNPGDDGRVRVQKKLFGPWELVTEQESRRLLWARDSKENRGPAETVRVRLAGLLPGDLLVLDRPEAGHLLLLPDADADGVLELPAPSAGEQLLLQRYGSPPVPLTLPEEPGRPLTIPAGALVTLPPTYALRASVVDAGTNSHILQQIFLRNELLFPGPGEPAEDGRTRSMNPGDYGVLVYRHTQSGGRSMLKETVRIRAGAEPPALPTLPQPHRRQIEGTVVESGSNRPVPDASVWAGIGLDDDSDRTAPTAVTDSVGRFRIEGLPAGSLTLTVRSARHLTTTVEVRLGSGDEGQKTVALALTPGPPAHIKVAGDKGGNPVVDDFTCINQYGMLVTAAIRDGVATVDQLAPGTWTALPLLGRLSVTTDDWDWLVRESGGLVFDHPSPAKRVLRWTSPPPRPVRLRLTAQGTVSDSLRLQVIHAGVPPHPGIWPDQTWESLPLGEIELDRLLPGAYRAIATSGTKTSVVDLNIPDDPSVVIPLAFDFRD